MIFTFLRSNSGFIFAIYPSSVVQTGVKSFGCENRTAQESPIHSWKRIVPSVVSASKSGAVSPMRRVMPATILGAMRILITGSSGHLGEALMRTLGGDRVGLDVLASPYTQIVGSIADRDVVRRAVAGMDAILHTATLHKPHVGSHGRAEFVDTNVTGTLNLLEEAVAAGVGRFVFTSTTSAFGRALVPPPGAPAAWITEDVVPVPRNVYGVTKRAAEDVCELVHRDHGLPCLILRTSRFFPEADDRDDVRDAYDDANLKVNELLYRRADIEDVVSAHVCALRSDVGFGRYIVSATTPFTRADLQELRDDAPSVVRRLF